MSLACIGTLCLALAGCAHRAADLSGVSADLAIIHASVVDPEAGIVLPDQTVLIRGRRIAAMVTGGAARVPENAKVLDAAGRFLIPGLWDMHVHIADPVYLPLFVRNGVTGVRDMGGGLAEPGNGCESVAAPTLQSWRSRIRSGEWTGPDIILSGPAVSATGWPTSLQVRTVEEARVAVDTLQGLGVDFIKVYEKIPLVAYKALAVYARAANLPLAGHVPAETVGLLDAIAAGQRSIEHVRDALLMCFTPDPDQLQTFFAADRWNADDIAWGRARHAECPAVEQGLRSQQVWLTPTLVVEHAKIAVEDPAVRNDSRRRALPASVQLGFIEHAKKKLEQPKDERASERLWWDTQKKLAGHMHAVGARLLAGTDAACEGGLPGASLHDELAFLVNAGLSPLEALRTATTEPAAYLDRTGVQGIIRAGAEADLILLGGNPLTDIANTRKIDIVVLDGRLLPRVAERPSHSIDRCPGALRESTERSCCQQQHLRRTTSCDLPLPQRIPHAGLAIHQRLQSLSASN